MRRIIITVEDTGGELKIHLENSSKNSSPTEEHIEQALTKVVRGVLKHFQESFQQSESGLVDSDGRLM